ncbi:MAG: hypothetical protein K9M55_11380, partial [Candidatus Marinimicrobia bacterium]|nr:hypothetical protein [Candidatus Neomarinimicrobiota bacterium]
SNNNSELYGLGSEIRYLDKYFGRIGYQAGTDIQGLSFGGGVQIMNNVGMDYAFNAMEYFGPRHRFALSIKF